MSSRRLRPVSSDPGSGVYKQRTPVHSLHSELCPCFTCCRGLLDSAFPLYPAEPPLTTCLHSMSSHPAPQSPLRSPTPSPAPPPPPPPPQPWLLPQRQVFIPHQLPPRGWPRRYREAAALSSLSPSRGLALAMDFLFLGRWRRQEGRVGQGRVTPSPGQRRVYPDVLLEPHLSLQLQEGDGPSQVGAGRVEWAGVLSMCGRGLAPGDFL